MVRRWKSINLSTELQVRSWTHGLGIKQTSQEVYGLARNIPSVLVDLGLFSNLDTCMELDRDFPVNLFRLLI
jgi:hypothetical protein